MFEILFVFGRNMVWSVARGLRFLGFASPRAAKIYGDLAEIYGASPQFFATVSGLSFAHKTQRAKSEINVFGIESVEQSDQDPQWVLLAGGREDSSHRQTRVETLVDRRPVRGNSSEWNYWGYNYNMHPLH